MNNTSYQTPNNNLCVFCHQPVKEGIARDFELTTDKPILCLKCAEEIACTVTIKTGGFW
jgi:hypothetical protein